MEELRLIFRTMSNPTRMAIINFLNKKNIACFSDIRHEFNVNNNTAHYHLKKLITANLVKKNGKYSITDFGRKIATIFEDFDKEISKFNMVRK